MKALFYSHTGKVSGAEHVLLLFLEGMDRSRIEPLAVCPADGGLSERIASSGVRVSTVKNFEAGFTLRPDLIAKHIVSAVGSIDELKKNIAAEAPAVIHANSIRAGLVATLASIGTGIPVVWHVHDELKPHPISSAIRLIAAFSRRTSVLAVSRATLESFKGRVLRFRDFEKRSGVVLNGIDGKRFQVAEEKGEEIRASLGIARDEVVFASIGQMTPRKNQKGLVEAFARVSGSVPKIRLLMVGTPIFDGDEEYFDEVKELVRSYGLEGRVHFLGQRKDVPEIVSASDAVVVNSTSEALVLVAIEAMMGGRPVIATKVGGTSELIRHLSSGWLIPPHDGASLEEALVSFTTSPALRMALGQEGRRVARLEFNSNRFVAEFERFIGSRKFTESKEVAGIVAMSEAGAGIK